MTPQEINDRVDALCMLLDIPLNDRKRDIIAKELCSLAIATFEAAKKIIC